MSRLPEKLTDPSQRQRLVADAAQVLSEEVASKGGLSGFAIKAGYKLVQGVKPGFVEEAIDALLDDFVAALEPLVAKAQAAQQPIAGSLSAEAGSVADALLAITDRRARGAQRAALRGAYDKLRPTAKRHVEEAAPRLARLLEKHA